MASGTRMRDPERRERILSVATELISEQGYQAVNIRQIGARAGIVGSGVYRHFEGKSAILAELFDRVTDRLILNAQESLAENNPRKTLDRLIDDLIDFTVNDSQLCRVYIAEARNLPDEDRKRLRWKQRQYLNLWRDVVWTLGPTRSEEKTRIAIYAAIAGVHSTLRFTPQLPAGELQDYLREVALRTLGVHPEPAAKEAPRAVEETAPTP